MTASGFAQVARVRRKELPTRLAMAAFIGLTAWAITGTLWPLAWFGAVLVSQAIDWAVFRRLTLDGAGEPRGAYRLLCLASATQTTAIYSSIAAFLWFQGGTLGQLFAMVQVAGALLHVSLHMHHQRSLLIAAVAPHGLYFLGLPILGAMLDRNWAELLVAVACLLYVAHLVAAVKQTSSSTKALREAGLLAEQERARAEVASAAKSDFLAVISHEIRTPMNAVLSAANLLRRTRLDRDQREHVDMLLDAGDVLMGLLNDVLDFSKIEAGKMELEQADMSVRDRLAALSRLWGPKAMAQGLRLTVDVDDAVPDVIRTDPLRLQQILFNLLSNAVKFTRRGEIKVSVGFQAAVLTVAVQDTGVGIPADRLAGVFNSFEQVEAGTTRRFGGTGLGLAICRRLAELMGGDLTVESSEGEGSTFTLILPVEAGQAIPARPAAAPSDATPVLQGKTILAADDHEVNRRILSLLLAPHGCRLTMVENGAEAVDAAAVQPFDLILMDMQMPVMDGLQATRAIRAGGANADTPVIALTANALDVHRAAWAEAGVARFLTKPIDPDLLVGALAEAAQERERRAYAA
ncbi:MAG: response regulator [Caulobacteraceae bacterium]|nr:response regulator [Caulobacteraceae bacterium]